MKTLGKAVRLAFTASFIFTQSLQAQESIQVYPEPASQEGKFMPGFGDDGIVKVRYTIKADGKIDDIEIIDYFSNSFLNTMLRQTVSKWTFKPGTLDGQPADFLNQEYLFVVRVNPDAPPMPFGPGARGARPPATEENGEAAGPPDFSTMPAIPLAMSREAKESIDKIYEIFAAKDYDKAMKEVTKLLRGQVHTVFDYSLAQELKSSIHMNQNEMFAALEASKLATMHAVNPQGVDQYFLEDSLLQTALRRKFLLALAVHQNSLAWDTYELLNSKFPLPVDDALHAQAQNIRAQLDSPEPMALIAKLVEDKWSYSPVHRIFTVTDVDGKLNRIDARCEHRNLKLEYQEGVDWTLPESLGACELDFVGKDGTQFTVYEFAE